MPFRLLASLLFALCLATPTAAQHADALHAALTAMHEMERDSLGHPVGDVHANAIEVQRAAAQGLQMAAALPQMLRAEAEAIEASELDYLAGNPYRTPRALRVLNVLSIAAPLAGTALLIAGETDAATSLALTSASVGGIGSLLTLRENKRARRADAADNARRAKSRAGRTVLTAEFLALAHALEHLNEDAAALAASDQVDAAALGKLAHLGGDLLGGDLLMVNSLVGESDYWLTAETRELLQPLAQEMARLRAEAGAFLPLLPRATQAVHP